MRRCKLAATYLAISIDRLTRFPVPLHLRPLIAYNSMLLSGLVERHLAQSNEKALDLLRRISPAAWQHLHFPGHYAFRNKSNPIDLDAILAGIDWW